MTISSMSLKIDNSRTVVKRTFIIIFVFLFSALVSRLYFWEKNYYDTYSDMVRATDEEVDETERDEDDKEAYKVCPSCIRFLSIYDLDIDRALVKPVGLTKSGAVDTVNNIFDVAWYRASQKPGEGGTSLLNAHNGGPTKTGVFGKLYTLPIGSIVTLERGDGEIFNYKITENQIMPLADANNYMGNMLRSPEPGKESVSLISCAGRYSTSMRTFMDRAMLRGILVERGSEEDQEATKKVKANEKFKSGKLKNSKSQKKTNNN